MAVTIEAADAYIDLNVIDVTDWQESENAHKQRILNAGEGTLKRLYPDYVIPDEAVYAYAANLAVAFNDTNKLNNQGVASFSVTGVASFNFKDTDKREMTAFIPEVSKDLIGEANGVKLTGRHTVWTVM
jgi:hypothetical protein